MSLPIGDVPLFLTGSAALLWFSRKPLRHPGSHGFYRFFGWEAILAVVVLNRNASGGQILSQSLLLVSLALLLLGVLGLVQRGRPGAQRGGQALFGWEQTTALVTSGVFGLIRHPLYASLLALDWGMFFRATGGVSLCFALIATYFMWRTTRADEEECLAYFGEPYRAYMKRTRRYIPWIL